MSTSNLQKHSPERDSAPYTSNANDSGFSELYHLLEHEENNWTIPGATNEYQTCSEPFYKPFNGPWSSSPNKTCSSTNISFQQSLDSISKGCFTESARFQPINTGYTLSRKDGLFFSLPKVIVQKKPMISHPNTCPKQESTLTNSTYSSEQQSALISNQYAPSKDTIVNSCKEISSPTRLYKIAPKVQIDIFDDKPVYRNDVVSSKSNLTHSNFERNKGGKPQYHPNISGFTEYFLKNTSTNPIPMLDLYNRPINTCIVNQPVTQPRLSRHMTIPLPEQPKTNNSLEKVFSVPVTLSRPTRQETPAFSTFPSIVNTVALPIYNPLPSNLPAFQRIPISSSCESINTLSSWTSPAPFEISKPVQLDNNSTPYTSSERLTFQDVRSVKDPHAIPLNAIPPIHSNGRSFPVPPLTSSNFQGLTRMPNAQSKIENVIKKEPFYKERLPQAPLTVPQFEDMSDDDTHLGQTKDFNDNKVQFPSSYSDISGEESQAETSTASDSSSDENNNTVLAYPTRKARKYKRKSIKPRRSPDTRDPRFKGVTVWLQTEFKEGQSNLRLSAFYSNVKVGLIKPRYALRRNSGSLPLENHSYSEAEGYSPPTPCRETYGSAKTCASCRTRRTPLWRDAEDGTPLCNACGIRYKKYRLRCSRCWYIPKKDIKTYPNCPACGSALRYSFHRKSW